MTNKLPPGTGGRAPVPANPARFVPVDPGLMGMPYPQLEGTDWRRHLAALARYKWLIIGVTVVGTLVGYGVSQLMPPVYKAEATLWIEVKQPEARDRGPLGSAQLLDSYGWLDLLETYTVLDHVAQELRLHVHPASEDDAAALASFETAERFRAGRYRLERPGDGTSYALYGEADRVVDRGAWGDSVGFEIGFRWSPPADALDPGQSAEFGVITLRDAARGLRDQLVTKVDPEGNFLSLSLSGADPERVTEIVNAVAHRYVAVADRLKREKLTELTRILREQLTRAEAQLAQAEDAMRAFRKAGPAVTPREARGAPEPLVGDYLDMKVARDQAARDRQAIEQVLRSGDDGDIAALEMVAAVRSSTPLTQALDELTEKQAEIRALRYQYTEEYPPVQRLAEEIRTLREQTIPSLAASVVADLRRREGQLAQWLSPLESELKSFPNRAIDEAALQRRLTLAEDLYTTLQRRFDEAQLAEASTLADVQILDAAVVPRTPAQDAGPRIVLVAFAGSLGTALFGALLLGRIDRRVRFPEQVSFEMGLPILGAIPHVGRRRGRTLTDRATAEHVEALRGIRLNLLHAFGAPPPLLLTVTSPGSGDGKSFVSSRLALAFADAGYRTILIDGDVRRGRLHYTLGRRRRPGLIDHLSGRAAEHEIVQPTGFGPLDFIACGQRSQGGPELLGAPAMRELLATLRTQYEVIIVDSAPMAAAVDPFVLGTATGHLVVVLRTGITDREITSAKLDMLDRLPIRLLGAIMNDVRADGAYQLYSYYLPGYEAGEEDDERELPAPATM